MNKEKIYGWLDEIVALTGDIRMEVAGGEPEPPDPQPPGGTVIENGADLQAALAEGGQLVLAEGASFSQTASYKVTESGTSVTGEGANVVESENDHAFDIPINVDGLKFANLAVVADANEAVQIGVNGSSQNTVEAAPNGVVFDRVTSNGHRGKRVFDNNGANVEFHNCDVRDCWSPDGVDSQAICMLNAPGPMLVEGGYFEAAAENLMVGGDTMKIPDCRPSNITIRNATFTKPLAWKTAGTPKVKNLLELKDGDNVLIENCDFTNSWASAQDGYGFTFTPSNGGVNRNVVVKNCRMSNVSGIVNVIGVDKSGINKLRTQVSFLGGTYRTNKAENAGRGIFALIGQGPEFFVAEDCDITVDGTTFIEIYTPGNVDLLRVVNCKWNYPKYGIRIGGYSHGEDYYNICGDIVIEGCTISGAASGFKTRYPNNTYVDAYKFGDKAERHRFGLLPEDRGDEGEARTGTYII